MDPSQAPSHYKGLANKNIQSHSFKMLQRALEGGNHGNFACGIFDFQGGVLKDFYYDFVQI